MYVSCSGNKLLRDGRGCVFKIKLREKKKNTETCTNVLGTITHVITGRHRLLQAPTVFNGLETRWRLKSSCGPNWGSLKAANGPRPRFAHSWYRREHRDICRNKLWYSNIGSWLHINPSNSSTVYQSWCSALLCTLPFLLLLSAKGMWVVLLVEFRVALLAN